MTHSSGIPVSKELHDAFDSARTEGGIRWIQVQIEDDGTSERLILVNKESLLNDIESEFNALQGHMELKTPCYFLFRLDSSGLHGYEWTLLAYVPDDSTVKERMLYASTRDIMKRQLGYTYFANEMYGTDPSDFTWSAYQNSLRKDAQAVLSASERMVMSEKRAEIDTGGSTQYVHSVSFPMSSDAKSKVKSITSGGPNLVQLSVDTNRETIELSACKNCSLAALSSEIPSTEPRFSIFRWDHKHEGKSLSSIVFLYSCANDAPIKSKMLYSSVKAVVAGTCEELGATVDKKLEVSDPDEVTEQLITDAIHPPKAEEKKTFSRPSRPGRGPRRLNRNR